MRRAVTPPAELVMSAEANDEIDSEPAHKAVSVLQDYDDDSWKFGKSPASYAAASVYIGYVKSEISSGLTQSGAGDLFDVSAVTVRKRLSELLSEEEREELRKSARV